ncbi:MAG TPA: hypothetical protein VN750_07365 [Steroidobacteraceae bacterium]|nr:hypothetical protein [Steroidobacteraceae bacterium]
MSEPALEADEGLLEECIDELDALIERLDRFPAFVLALALRVHLNALLNAMKVDDQIGDRELRAFVAGVHPDPDDAFGDENQ